MGLAHCWVVALLTASPHAEPLPSRIVAADGPSDTEHWAAGRPGLSDVDLLIALRDDDASLLCLGGRARSPGPGRGRCNTPVPYTRTCPDLSPASSCCQAL